MEVVLRERKVDGILRASLFDQDYRKKRNASLRQALWDAQ